MGRDANGTYTLPSGSTVVTGDFVLASQHNTPLLDLVADANAARPVVAGGTGATTAAAARTNLGVAASAATISAASVMSIYPGLQIALRGHTAEADGGEAIYEYTASEPTHEAKFQDAGGNWFRLASRPISPQMFHPTDDDEAWSRMADYIEVEAAAGRWRYGFQETPDIIDGRGKTFEFTSDVTIEEGVHLHNMRMTFDACTLTLGVDTSPQSEVWKWVFTSVHAEYVGSSDYSGAMIYLPKCAGVYMDAACLFDAGVDTARARYAVYMGRYYAFGPSIYSGFRGGDCALRIGREADQTSIILHPTLMDRSREYNCIICNPVGASIKLDNEHSEGKAVLAITSKTNGSATIAQGVEIFGGYAYDANTDQDLPSGDSVETFGDACVVKVGHDLEGTEGWDGGVDPITSDSGTHGVDRTFTARMFSFHDLYMVGDNAEFCIDFSGIGFVDIERVVWGGTPDSGTIKLLRVYGPCNEVRIKSVVDQNNSSTVLPVCDISGVTDVAIPMWSRGNSDFSWTIAGADVEGLLTYDRQDGALTIVDNVCTMTFSVVWTAVTTQPEGALTLIGSPDISEAAADGRTGIFPVQRGFRGVTANLFVAAKIFEGHSYITLEESDSISPVDGAELESGGEISGTLVYHVNPWA